jgi:pimeloyl-ACP methyl ester carboxylesterase
MPWMNGRLLVSIGVASLAACSTPGGQDAVMMELMPAAGAPLKACTALANGFTFEQTALSSARVISAGTLKVGAAAVGEHCQVLGKMHERVSPVDGQTYAIGFEMRLPRDWNGRFFYQGNGGLDGFVPPAVGAVSGGGAITHALQQGFAVISSDAGHNVKQLPLFGLDPQARLDYGWQAVAKLTPMAKALIEAAYGRPPARSYIGGSSNGGRHAMVAATRLPHEYDGFLAVAPGFNLPKAAVAQLYGAQQYAKVATDPKNLETAFTPAERKLVAGRVLAACDALDGAADGLVEDVAGCRTAFDLQRDVPTCTGARDGSCLSAAQKTAVGNVFAGARNSRGEALYARFPYDPGLTYSDWADWEFKYSVTNRDPVAVGFVFQVPPADPAIQSDLLAFALSFNLDSDASKIYASSATYAASAMSFMTPPNVTRLDTLRQRGARLLVVHGNADPVFSVDDTAAWYDAVRAAYGAETSRFVRFFRVPGMGHSRGGPSTDQFDALSALVGWVERGRAPERIVASARGAGNAGGVNPDVPANWAPNRTRPLCPYPAIARYNGSGSVELAESFSCR